MIIMLTHDIFIYYILISIYNNPHCENLYARALHEPLPVLVFLVFAMGFILDENHCSSFLKLGNSDYSFAAEAHSN